MSTTFSVSIYKDVVFYACTCTTLSLFNSVYKNFYINTFPLKALLSKNCIIFFCVDIFIIF